MGEGAGSTVPRIKGINHNLGIYGWDLRDALVSTAEMLEEQIDQPTDHFFKQIVENANERAALRVLKSAQDDLTPFGAAAQLGAEGTEEEEGEGHGIEILRPSGSEQRPPQHAQARGNLERGRLR